MTQVCHSVSPLHVSLGLRIDIDCRLSGRKASSGVLVGDS